MGCGNSTAVQPVVNPSTTPPAAAPAVVAATAGRKCVLVLRNAVTGAASFSNKGVDKAIVSLKAAFPEVVILDRDLTKEQVPLLNEETCDAIRNGKTDTAAQKEADALANKLIDEIKSVDLIIVGLPRYNFGVPVSFKTYLDYVARPRITFRYGPNGPEGLLPDIPVWLVMSAGGLYGDDYYPEWLNAALPFVGLKSLRNLRIEGTGMGKGDEALAQLETDLAEALKTL